MRPIYGCPDNFRDALTTPPLLFFTKFYGPLFRWCRPKERRWVPIGPPYTSSISTRLPEILDCSFQWGWWISNLREGEAEGGWGWYRSKERWWASIGHPVTFPLSLRVSEILPLLFSRMPLFPYPTYSLPKISPCSPGTRWIAFWLRRAKVLGQLSVQLVFKISNLCDHNPPTSQTDRRTDDIRSQDRAFALKCIAR